MNLCSRLESFKITVVGNDDITLNPTKKKLTSLGSNIDFTPALLNYTVFSSWKNYQNKNQFKTTFSKQHLQKRFPYSKSSKLHKDLKQLQQLNVLRSKLVRPGVYELEPVCATYSGSNHRSLLELMARHALSSKPYVQGCKYGLKQSRMFELKKYISKIFDLFYNVFSKDARMAGSMFPVLYGHKAEEMLKLSSRTVREYLRHLSYLYNIRFVPMKSCKGMIYAVLGTYSDSNHSHYPEHGLFFESKQLSLFENQDVASIKQNCTIHSKKIVDPNYKQKKNASQSIRKKPKFISQFSLGIPKHKKEKNQEALDLASKTTAMLEQEKEKIKRIMIDDEKWDKFLERDLQKLKYLQKSNPKRFEKIVKIVEQKQRWLGNIISLITSGDLRNIRMVCAVKVMMEEHMKSNTFSEDVKNKTDCIAKQEQELEDTCTNIVESKFFGKTFDKITKQDVVKKMILARKTNASEDEIVDIGMILEFLKKKQHRIWRNFQDLDYSRFKQAIELINDKMLIIAESGRMQ